MLPHVNEKDIFKSSARRKILILAEGFEERSLSWIDNEKNTLIFDEAIICKYFNHKKTRFDDLKIAVKKHCKTEPIVFEYNRFEPTSFEMNFRFKIQSISDYDEVFIDISVMSKFLIMIIICSLINFRGKLKIIYSEPNQWGPTEKQFEEAISTKEFGSWISLSSVGVRDIVRTPNLSSVTMQNCPVYLIAFLSFNERLLSALISEISPSRLQLVNHSCERQKWREPAMIEIHKDVIDEYYNKGIEEIFTTTVLDYKAVFEKLAEIYRERCYDYRIMVSPTGGKIHAVSTALFKLCCPDVHVEYPTPESYVFDNYTSAESCSVHQITFPCFKNFIKELSNSYNLNG